MQMAVAARTLGATSTEIQFHYDLSHAFYALWLDPTLTYSCALFDETDDLEAAQIAKLDFHVAQSELAAGERLLDVGCGWGGLLARAHATREGVSSVGLTLSVDQRDVAVARGLQGADIRLEGWDALEDERFDAVISIGAFEHFARPEMTSDERIAEYRRFFERMAGVLRPGRCLSLQTITFDKMKDEDFPRWISERIFPGSILPRPHEILAACDGLFSVESCRNDAAHYGRTCRLWAERLEAVEADAVALAGPERTAEYDRYLRMSAVAFERSLFGLWRLKLRRHA